LREPGVEGKIILKVTLSNYCLYNDGRN